MATLNENLISLQKRFIILFLGLITFGSFTKEKVRARKRAERSPKKKAHFAPSSRRDDGDKNNDDDDAIAEEPTSSELQMG